MFNSAIPRFQDLLERIPDEVKADRYCRGLLSLLSGHAHHSTQVGPAQWSKKRLIGVLSSLRPWELRCPETVAAVKVTRIFICRVNEEQFTSIWLRFLHDHKKSSCVCVCVCVRKFPCPIKLGACSAHDCSESIKHGTSHTRSVACPPSAHA